MDDREQFKLPKIMGHRGACGYAPENTLESIHTAADLGMEWVEFDVKLTKDTIPILFHDSTLDRTTNGSGKVADIPWEEMRNLEAGSWFGESFAGAKIPTLEDAVEVLIERDLSLNLEIKPCEGREKETAENVLDIMSRLWDDTDSILVSSFSLIALETALEMIPEWRRGILLPGGWPDRWPHDLDAAIDYLKPASINFNGNDITKDAIDELKSKGLLLASYTINDDTILRRLQSSGVDCFITDFPDEMQEALITVY